MEGIDQVAGGEFFCDQGEGAFFVALLGREKFAGAAGGVDELVGFCQVGDVEAAEGEGELAGIVEGEFAGAEGIPGEHIPGGEGVEALGVGLGEFVEAVVGDRSPGFGKGFFGADFVAGGVEDGVVAGEDVEGGTEGTQVEVDPRDVVRLQIRGHVVRRGWRHRDGDHPTRLVRRWGRVCGRRGGRCWRRSFSVPGVGFGGFRC